MTKKHSGGAKHLKEIKEKTNFRSGVCHTGKLRQSQTGSENLPGKPFSTFICWMNLGRHEGCSECQHRVTD